MKRLTKITTLFLDVGGVLLTNGWGHSSRALAAKAFDLNLDEMENLSIDELEALRDVTVRTIDVRINRAKEKASG